MMWTLFGIYDHWMIFFPDCAFHGILVGYHGNINSEKNKDFFNDCSSKTTELVGLIWYKCYKGKEQLKKAMSANLPLGLVAMKTENFHRNLYEKMVKLHLFHNK